MASTHLHIEGERGEKTNSANHSTPMDDAEASKCSASGQSVLSIHKVIVIQMLKCQPEAWDDQVCSGSPFLTLPLVAHPPAA